MVNINKYIKALLQPAGGHQESHKAHQAGNINPLFCNDCMKSSFWSMQFFNSFLWFQVLVDWGYSPVMPPTTPCPVTSLVLNFPGYKERAPKILPSAISHPWRMYWG